MGSPNATELYGRISADSEAGAAATRTWCFERAMASMSSTVRGNAGPATTWTASGIGSVPRAPIANSVIPAGGGAEDPVADPAASGDPAQSNAVASGHGDSFKYSENHFG